MDAGARRIDLALPAEMVDRSAQSRRLGQRATGTEVLCPVPAASRHPSGPHQTHQHRSRDARCQRVLAAPGLRPVADGPMPQPCEARPRPQRRAACYARDDEQRSVRAWRAAHTRALAQSTSPAPPAPDASGGADHRRGHRRGGAAVHGAGRPGAVRHRPRTDLRPGPGGGTALACAHRLAPHPAWPGGPAHLRRHGGLAHLGPLGPHRSAGQPDRSVRGGPARLPRHGRDVVPRPRPTGVDQDGRRRRAGGSR